MDLSKVETLAIFAGIVEGKNETVTFELKKSGDYFYLVEKSVLGGIENGGFTCSIKVEIVIKYLAEMLPKANSLIECLGEFCIQYVNYILGHQGVGIGDS